MAVMVVDVNAWKRMEADGERLSILEKNYIAVSESRLAALERIKELEALRAEVTRGIAYREQELGKRIKELEAAIRVKGIALGLAQSRCEELEADGERLDWLERNPNFLEQWWVGPVCELRQAIDKARKEE